MEKGGNIPRHVAIIMDGNGRWAHKRGLPKIAGHRAGVKSAEEAIRTSGELGIKVLTLYTFSTENWKRPKDEVGALFSLLEYSLEKEYDKLKSNGVRLMVTGDTAGLPDRTRANLEKAIKATAANDRLILNIALNYGSRQEITMAARGIARDVLNKKITLEDIDEKLFESYLYTAGLPDPDLVIRTSGESRVSNFLLWQISYAEIYITDTLWPDFGKEEFNKAVSVYQQRERRFGG